MPLQRAPDDRGRAQSFGAPPSKKTGLDLAESLRLQAVDALANIRTRRIVVGYLPRNTATLVTNSWRSAKNQQTTRVKCGNGTTDAGIIALATHCPSLTSMDLCGCSNITDAAVIALATHCPSLTWLGSAGCPNLTAAAVATLRRAGIGYDFGNDLGGEGV